MIDNFDLIYDLSKRIKINDSSSECKYAADFEVIRNLATINLASLSEEGR